MEFLKKDIKLEILIEILRALWLYLKDDQVPAIVTIANSIVELTTAELIIYIIT
jgi:hypothetical protein